MPAELRLVRRLQQLYEDATGSRLKRAVLEGQVSVDGKIVDDPGTLVSEDQTIEWDQNRRIQRRVDTSLEVLFEDEDCIAVIKPSGLLTHPTEAKERDTLVSRVSNYLARRYRGRQYVAVVHRLDKETSGILVFARSRQGLEKLQNQLRAHSMDRRYLAVVEGNVGSDSGTYRWELVEDRGDRRKGVAREGQVGIPAVTSWKVKQRFGFATLVEARLQTGRTHQIRIHFTHAGHPLVGDPVYRDSDLPPFPVPFGRQALHAGHLGFETPSGQHVSLDAPPPPDFKRLLESLEALSRRTRRDTKEA